MLNTLPEFFHRHLDRIIIGSLISFYIYFLYTLETKEDILQTSLFATIIIATVAISRWLISYLQEDPLKTRQPATSHEESTRQLESFTKALNDTFIYATGNIQESLERQIRHIESISNQIEGSFGAPRVQPISAEPLKLTSDERRKLVNSLKDTIASATTKDILKAIYEKSADEARSESHRRQQERFDFAQKNYEKSQNRIMREIEALGRRGNINLVIGIMATTAALGVLANAVYVGTDIPNNLESLAMFYIPRVSLSLFVELFAFFFLRLYKDSLEKIRFFQNELTSIESRYTVLCIALDENVEIRTGVLLRLASVDRNSALLNNQVKDAIKRKSSNAKAMNAALKSMEELSKK